MNRYFLLVTISLVIISCNVHKSDKLMDDASRMMAMALKDSAKVQMIDSVHNFGTATEGEKVEFSYRFKNISTKPLVVTKTSASCGCTVPEKPEKPVLPGEIGVIKVVFNSRGKVGHNTKTIEVLSNAYPPFPELTLTGEVIAK